MLGVQLIWEFGLQKQILTLSTLFPPYPNAYRKATLYHFFSPALRRELTSSNTGDQS